MANYASFFCERFVTTKSLFPVRDLKIKLSHCPSAGNDSLSKEEISSSITQPEKVNIPSNANVNANTFFIKCSYW